MEATDKNKIVFRRFQNGYKCDGASNRNKTFTSTLPSNNDSVKWFAFCEIFTSRVGKTCRTNADRGTFLRLVIATDCSKGNGVLSVSWYPLMSDLIESKTKPQSR